MECPNLGAIFLCSGVECQHCKLLYILQMWPYLVRYSLLLTSFSFFVAIVFILWSLICYCFCSFCTISSCIFCYCSQSCCWIILPYSYWFLHCFSCCCSLFSYCWQGLKANCLYYWYNFCSSFYTSCGCFCVMSFPPS